MTITIDPTVDILKSFGIKNSYEYNQRLERLKLEMLIRDIQLYKKIREIIEREFKDHLYEVLKEKEKKLKELIDKEGQPKTTDKKGKRGRRKKSEDKQQDQQNQVKEINIDDKTSEHIEKQVNNVIDYISGHFTSKILEHVVYTGQAKNDAMKIAIASNFLMRFKSLGISKDTAEQVLWNAGLDEDTIKKTMKDYSRGRGIFRKKLKVYQSGVFAFGYNDPLTVCFESANRCVESSRKNVKNAHMEFISTLSQQFGENTVFMCQKIIPSLYHMLTGITKNQTKLNTIASELGILTGLYAGDIQKTAQQLGLKVQSNVNKETVSNIFKETIKGAENTDDLINSENDMEKRNKKEDKQEEQRTSQYNNMKINNDNNDNEKQLDEVQIVNL